MSEGEYKYTCGQCEKFKRANCTFDASKVVAKDDDACVDFKWLGNYFIDKTFIPAWLAKDVMKREKFVTHRDSRVLWVYTNGAYSPDGESRIHELAREYLGDFSKKERVNETVSHIRETTYTNPEEFIPPIHLINVKNGIFDMEKCELMDHTSDIIFTNELPVDYNPKADCPNIKKFLKEILHKDDIPVVQEIVGYCLLRDYCFAKAVMLLGEGANGKSSLLNLVVALLGEDNIATPSLQNLLSNRFSKASLYGKMANVHADLPTYKLKYTGTFKMLTGQDIIYAEHKHTKAFEFKNYAKLLYSANELPQTEDMSEAFWRRWIIVDFPNTFPEGDPKTNPNVLEMLTTPEELSGFLNWALAGLRRLLKNKKFTMTKSRNDIEVEWVTRTDSLRAFVMNHVTSDPECAVMKDDFFISYQEFCDEHDTTPISKAMVGRNLPTMVPKVLSFRLGGSGTQKRAWGGLRLSDEFEERNQDISSVPDSTDSQDNLTTYTISSFPPNKKKRPVYPSSNSNKKEPEIPQETIVKRYREIYDEIKNIDRHRHMDFMMMTKRIVKEFNIDEERAKSILKNLITQGDFPITVPEKNK